MQPTEKTTVPDKSFSLVDSSEADARKVLEVLPKRFARFGLTLHPTKTRLVRFRPHREQRVETFVLPGLHPLLGEVTPRALGYQAQDGER
ncbi:MAG: hypothetical protein HLX48_11765 [Halomonas sp.]|uniref:hypothetical protein n=1 Tax=Halomonas sp. TaxID=1486246 RepID=UPI00181CCE1E|nr:hypothetical protein [Halomonas sp.]NWN83647.1 hypothetical protein [Halomonas sp.]